MSWERSGWSTRSADVHGPFGGGSVQGAATGSLLDAVRENEDAARYLAWPGDFEPDRGDHVEEVHLASGAALEGFAGDGGG
ncbi:hypothetical protein [Streptomyces sp. NPDC000961]|uniref:hypothetical protein n=1 Tax=Streptomyces sp. NPDC000961 TaxID=3364541 RepID=UPI0036BD18F1